MNLTALRIGKPVAQSCDKGQEGEQCPEGLPLRRNGSDRGDAHIEHQGEVLRRDEGKALAVGNHRSGGDDAQKHANDDDADFSKVAVVVRQVNRSIEWDADVSVEVRSVHRSQADDDLVEPAECMSARRIGRVRVLDEVPKGGDVPPGVVEEEIEEGLLCPVATFGAEIEDGEDHACNERGRQHEALSGAPESYLGNAIISYCPRAQQKNGVEERPVSPPDGDVVGDDETNGYEQLTAVLDARAKQDAEVQDEEGRRHESYGVGKAVVQCPENVIGADLDDVRGYIPVGAKQHEVFQRDAHGESVNRKPHELVRKLQFLRLKDRGISFYWQREMHGKRSEYEGEIATTEQPYSLVAQAEGDEFLRQRHVVGDQQYGLRNG